MQQVTIFALLLLATCAFCSPMKPQVANKFIFDGQLHCGLGKQWCWTVKAYEDDGGIGQDDHLASASRCTTSADDHYHLLGYMDGDGDTNDFYELYLHVAHTCTKNGTKEYSKHDLGFKPMHTKKTLYLEKNITLG